MKKLFLQAGEQFLAVKVKRHWFKSAQVTFDEVKKETMDQLYLTHLKNNTVEDICVLNLNEKIETSWSIHSRFLTVGEYGFPVLKQGNRKIEVPAGGFPADNILRLARIRLGLEQADIYSIHRLQPGH